MYLGDREILAYSPDEADLLATERKLLALWEAIERATQARDFRPKPSRLCDWCDHKAAGSEGGCPEFGGTVLPWPTVVPGPGASEQRHLDARDRSAPSVAAPLPVVSEAPSQE